MPKLIDLSGQRFGRFVVVSYAGSNKQGAAMWKCVCDCGNQKTVVGSDLRRGKTLSCGCFHSEKQKKLATTYGYSNTRIAQIWRSMINRCCNPNNTSYHHYGGRGIAVCDEWSTNVDNFQKWALANGYSDGLTIDRIDTNGDYEPSNCRWVPMKIQQNNRRNNIQITSNNQTHTLSEWADITGIAYHVIKSRIAKGWTVERALGEPTHKWTRGGQHSRRGNTR